MADSGVPRTESFLQVPTSQLLEEVSLSAGGSRPPV